MRTRLAIKITMLVQYRDILQYKKRGRFMLYLYRTLEVIYRPPEVVIQVYESQLMQTGTTLNLKSPEKVSGSKLKSS